MQSTEQLKPELSPVYINTRQKDLEGLMTIPPKSQSIIIFAHGSGSSRFSYRNQLVAKNLNDANIATLLFDMLTPEEHEQDQITGEYRFNISFLTQRLIDCIDWVRESAETKKLAAATEKFVGLFGASTGAAAAIGAAAARPQYVHSIVSRGGRPDLATASVLKKVQCATLFIVGELDKAVLDLNREAAAQLTAVHEIKVIPGATHLFEEPGKLAEVAKHAREWFKQAQILPTLSMK